MVWNRPLQAAFRALDQYRARRRALTEKIAECEDLKKQLSDLQLSAAQLQDGEPSLQAQIPHQILFHRSDGPYYEFTNFSHHPVTYKGRKYRTAQHLYQSFKFIKHRPDIAEHIRLNCPKPDDALLEARHFQPEVRKDWTKVHVQKMDETLWLKFTQHPDLKDLLLSTGGAELIMDSSKDSYWGLGANRRGRNELGNALERLRTKLRHS